MADQWTGRSGKGRPQAVVKRVEWVPGAVLTSHAALTGWLGPWVSKTTDPSTDVCVEVRESMSAYLIISWRHSDDRVGDRGFTSSFR